VWAVEQDASSKRALPLNDDSIANSGKGIDALVPWVLAKQAALSKKATSDESADEESDRVFNRYYHFFAPGELRTLVMEAALELGILEGSPHGCDSSVEEIKGLQIVKDDYEKSNFFVELLLWTA
jgi:tRNA (uracil-5-)-methyltransferase TRM9